MKGLGALGPFWPGRADVQLCIYSYMLKNDISSEATGPISMKLRRKYLLWVGIIIDTNEGPWCTVVILARPKRCAIAHS